jgi:hypothetical protein
LKFIEHEKEHREFWLDRSRRGGGNPGREPAAGSIDPPSLCHISQCPPCLGNWRLLLPFAYAINRIMTPVQYPVTAKNLDGNTF